jgi:putative flippase GtrA
MLRRLYLRLPEAHRQFISFCIVGGVGFIVDNGSLSVMVRIFGVDPIVGRVFSIAVFGMTATWYLNRTFTFRNRRDQPIWQEYLRFVAANGVGNLMNFIIYTVLVKNVALFGHIPELATVVGTAVGIAFNFTGAKYFVFRRISP